MQVLWDASNGACSVISAQVIAIGADGQPNFNVMYMPSAGAVMQSGVCNDIDRAEGLFS